jgi:hypothetical protein
MGNIMQSIVGVLESAEEYMIEPEGIMWNTEYIFIEADTGKLQFCYYPDENQRQGSIKEILTEILQVVDKKDEETTLLLLQFYNIVTEPDCRLEQVKNFLREKLGGINRSEEMYLNEDKDGTGGQAEESREIRSWKEIHRKERSREERIWEETNRRGRSREERNWEETTQRERSGKERNRGEGSQKKDKNAFSKLRGKETQNEKNGKREDGNNQESTVEKIVKTLLLLTAAINFILIALLLAEILTYDYIGYLLGAMAALIVLTIIYMSVSKEESPDEIMREYFEENGGMQNVIRGKVESPIIQEERCTPQKECCMPREEYCVSQEEYCMPQEEYCTPQKEYCVSQQEYCGETTVLSPDNYEDKKKEVVVEEFNRPLVLTPFEKGKYPAIQIEKSTVVGCMEEGCNYLLKERGISRMHAKLMKKEDGLYLLDLNSTNGTFLNGEGLISGEDVKIEEGDIVAFARCEYMVVQG